MTDQNTTDNEADQNRVLDRSERNGYEVVVEYVPEKSTTGDNDTNAVCDKCGEGFHAYIIPGREVYVCNPCKGED